MTFDGHDSWRTTPPDDHDNEYAEEDAMERDHADTMKALSDWAKQATGQQIRLGIKMLDNEIRQRIADAAAELKELRGRGAKPSRAKRADAGKPRLPKVVVANELEHDADPFAREVAR